MKKQPRGNRQLWPIEMQGGERGVWLICIQKKTEQQRGEWIFIFYLWLNVELSAKVTEAHT